MKNWFGWLQRYLAWAFPFVLIAMLWSRHCDGGPDVSAPAWLKLLWEVSSWNLMIWFAGILVFLLLLLFRTKSGDQFLKQLARLKERDEREVLITGQAARSAFLSTTGLLIFLIAVTSVQLSVKNLRPEEIRPDGHTKTISLGLDFDLLEKPKPLATDAHDDDDVVVEKSGLPISKLGLLMFILFWQLSAFYLSSRRELRD
jgi:hypothetical protein